MRSLLALVIVLVFASPTVAQWQYQTAESIIATTPRVTYGGYYGGYRGSYNRGGYGETATTFHYPNLNMSSTYYSSGGSSSTYHYPSLGISSTYYSD